MMDDCCEAASMLRAVVILAEDMLMLAMGVALSNLLTELLLPIDWVQFRGNSHEQFAD